MHKKANIEYRTNVRAADDILEVDERAKNPFSN